MYYAEMRTQLLLYKLHFWYITHSLSCRKENRDAFVNAFNC